MQNILLFSLCSFVWGSTWYAITFQLGDVDPLWSISYRFLLAGLILMAICFLQRVPVQFTPRQHLRIFLQGICFCGISYWLVYLSELYINSAQSALVCTSMLYLNVIIGHFWLGNPVRLPVVIGGMLGSLGIVMVFLPELATSLTTDLMKGITMAFVGCIFFSIGSLICEINKKSGLPLLPVVMTAMMYSSLFTAAFALSLGKLPSFQWSKPYVFSLLYLALFGSIMAMTSYVALIGRIGADRTAYVDIIYPIIALFIATMFEGYQWTTLSLLGVLVVLAGNYIALGVNSDKAHIAK